MAPLIFSVKFPYGTQFLFRSLMFTAGEDGNLELLTWGSVPNHLSPVYRKAPYFLADMSTSSTSGSACSDLNPHAGSYYISTMTSQGRPIGIPSKTTLRSGAISAGTMPSKPTASAWWVLPGQILWTVPAGTQPSGDLKRPMLGHSTIG
jgi:hypothetical protein